MRVISKDEAIKAGLELGIITVWKVILEVIFGCCFLGLVAGICYFVSCDCIIRCYGFHVEGVSLV